MDQFKPQRANMRIHIDAHSIQLRGGKVQYLCKSNGSSVRYRAHLTSMNMEGHRQMNRAKMRFLAYLLQRQTHKKFQECYDVILEASNGADKPLYDLLCDSDINADRVFNVVPPKRLDSLTNFLVAYRKT